MECHKRSMQEVTKIFCKMPQTLNNIENVVDFMLEINGGCHRRFIERRVTPRTTEIKDYMQSLKDFCEKIKDKLDSMLEQNEQNINQLKTKINSLHLEIERKSIEMKKLKVEKERTEASYNNAESQLENANLALHEAERKLATARNAQLGVGLGGAPLLVAAPLTLLIPIVGPFIAVGTAIAGYSMILASATVMEDDIESKKSFAISARDSKSSFETSLIYINKRLRILQVDIDTRYATERKLKSERTSLSNSVNDIKKLQTNMSEFLQMFNGGFCRLTEASGRSRVLHSSAVYAYNLKHLKPLVEAFCESFLSFAETELFDNLDVYRNIDLYQIRRIGNKAKAIQDARTSQLTYDEFDGFI